jgi:hypothetical protein
MFRGKDGNPALQESAVEVGVVGDYKHYPVEQITDGGIVDTLVGGHLIGNPGHVGDLRSDRKAGIFEPLPGAENFVDLPVLTVIFEVADAQLDDLVAIGIGAGGFDIYDGGDEFWTVIVWVVFGLRFQPTGDTVIAALDERPSHLFQRVPHLADVPNRLPQRSSRR